MEAGSVRCGGEVCGAGVGEVGVSVRYEEFVGEGVLSGRTPCHELRRRFVSFSA